MLLLDGIDGMTGADRENGQKRFLVLAGEPIPQLLRILRQPLSQGLGRRHQLLPRLGFLDALGAAVEIGHGRADPQDAICLRPGIENAERQRMNDGGKGHLRITGQPRLQGGGAVRRQILDQLGGEAGCGFVFPATTGGGLRLVGLPYRRLIFRLDEATPHVEGAVTADAYQHTGIRFRRVGP
jgi:hypothetical protein